MRPLLICICAALCWACDDESPSADGPDPGQQGADLGADVSVDGGVEGDAEPPEPDAGEADPDGALPEDDAAPVGGGNTVEGVAYEDFDETDRSTYDHEQGDDDPPLAGLTVRLIGAETEDEVTTDAEGRFEFADLAEGVYLVRPDTPDGLSCALRNCASRFADAIEAGEATLVVYGDSVPVVGDRPFFPTRVAQLFEPLANVDVRNVAVAGSTSPQWLPGTPNYENRLLPEVEDADLILVSIGGNDIVRYAANPALLSDIPAAVVGAVELIADIADNIIATRE